MIQPAKRRTLDPEKTRRNILEAAFTLFSERGFAATSMGDVANMANVQKSLVQYHFGSKEGLWQACLASRAAPVIEQLDRFLNGDAGDLASVVEARFVLMRDHPEIRKMLAWATIETVPVPAFISERRERLMAMMTAKTGKGRAPAMIVALAAMDGWFTFGGLYRRGLKGGREDMDEQILEFLKKMVTVL